jgi:hypothetical protein
MSEQYLVAGIAITIAALSQTGYGKGEGFVIEHLLREYSFRSSSKSTGERPSLQIEKVHVKIVFKSHLR